MSSEIEQLEKTIVWATERVAVLKAQESRQNTDTWPKCGDTFWSVNEFEGVSRNAWSDHYSDFAAVQLGNVFRTEEEARREAEARRVLTELRKLARESWGSDKVDWKNVDQYKWHLFYGHDEQALCVEYRLTCQHQGAVYFASREAAEAAIQTIGPDRALLLLEA